MTVLPVERSVRVKPLAVAIAGFEISTLQAPGELEVGGVKVMVFLSMVVTVASACFEIIVSAAVAAGCAVKNKEEVSAAVTAMARYLMRALFGK